MFAIKESLGGSGPQLTQMNVAQQRIGAVQDHAMKAVNDTSKALSQGVAQTRAVHADPRTKEALIAQIQKCF